MKKLAKSEMILILWQFKPSFLPEMLSQCLHEFFISLLKKCKKVKNCPESDMRCFDVEPSFILLVTIFFQQSGSAIDSGTLKGKGFNC